MSNESQPTDPESRLHAIFSEALSRPGPQERRRYLDQACGPDPDLRRQVESLLRAHDQADRFLDQSVTGELLDLVAEEPGTVIGRYRLLEELGQGGFGVVYRAEQLEPIKRQVALKIIKLGMDTKEVIARFEAERQALALMDHPNIAHVYDAGATPTGRPYFAMELVQGLPLTDYCDQHQLLVSDRLRLFLEVCQAVEHAHQRGIVHRDLKPSNVVVIEADGQPRVKVIDFGIAKSMQGRLTDRTLVTRREVLLGTPVYMSPEQLNLDADTIDARSDVYSLGVLLYELMAGVPPFESEMLRRAAFGEVQRILREVDPPKPSTRFEQLGPKTTEIAQRRALEPVALRRRLRGDLDWVAMRALEKDPGRRYPSAAALADDLQRHLRREPVVAGPPSRLYRLRKLAWRRQGLLVSAAVVLLVIGVAAFYSTHQHQRHAQYLRDAENRALTATALEPDRDTTETPDTRFIAGVANVDHHAALSPDRTLLAFVNWDGPASDICVHDLRIGEVRNLTRSEQHAPGLWEGCPDVFVWSPDSQWIAHLWIGGAETEPCLRLVSRDGETIRMLRSYHPKTTFLPEDWTADGRQILCRLSGDGPERWVLVSADTGELNHVTDDAPPGMEHPRISPDHRYLVYARRERPDDDESPRNVHLLNLETSRSTQLTFWPGNETTPIWTPRATNVVLFSSDRLGSWDLWGMQVQDGRPTPPFIVRYGVGDYAKRFAADGTLLLHRRMQHTDGYTIPILASAEISDGVEPVPTTMHYPVGTGSTRSLISQPAEHDLRHATPIRDGVEPVPTTMHYPVGTGSHKH